MVALIVGLIFVLFAGYSVLPVEWSLQWGTYVLDFLKGGIPIVALFIGLIAGEFAAAIFWTAIGAIYYVWTGMPGETFRILPA